MKEKYLENCILELKKLSKDRDENIITNYIKTLEPFMDLIKEKDDNSENIINKISKIMIYQKNITNDIIIQYGEKGNNFYVILKGTIGIFVPKYTEYYMNEEEFILHLLKLRKYNQNELIIQCLRSNAHIFSLPTERFDELLFDLQNTKSKEGAFLYNKKVINKAKEVFKYIKSEEFINNKKNIKNISPENYISLFEVDESIKQNTEDLKTLIKLKIEIDKEDANKRLIKIPNYKMISKYNIGYTFGELALENINKKRMATVICLTDCDFAVINKIEYNELIKDSVNHSKNKFYNIIYKYKVFNNISLATFDRKYFNDFRYLKMKKNSILFNQGDICNDVYFILNGEYELFVEKNVEEVNQIILQLKDIVDDLKKIITHETKIIINRNFRNKNKSYIKIKNNLNLFFNKYESEINLEEVAYIINNRDIVNKKKFFGKNFDKVISEKQKIKLGIYKSKQIIGLNDIINRYTENNKCVFSCKCCSFIGELYQIQYKNFLSMYENEENVKLYTSELLFQNIYYLIQRLLAHKKYIYEIAIKKENEYINLLLLEEENNQKNINNNNNKSQPKNFINTNKIINYSLIKDKNRINDNNNNTKKSDFKSLTNDKNSNIRIDTLSLRKNINLNILSHINILKIDYGSYFNSFNEKKNTDNRNDNNINNNNNRSMIESYVLSRNKNNTITPINKKFNNSLINKNTNYNIKFNSRNVLNKKKWKSKTKYTQFYSPEHQNNEEKIEFPVLIINDKEVKINNNINNYEGNYKKILKSFSFNEKNLSELARCKELKHIALFGDYSYNIENKLTYKSLLRKKKDIIIGRNNSKINFKNMTNMSVIHNYTDKKKFNNTSYNNDKERFLTYNLSDINGNKT